MRAKQPWYSHWYIWLIPFAAIIIFLYLSIQFSPTPVPFRPFTLNDVTQLLTGVLLIALFVERALEVFITTWRGPGTVDRENEQAEAEQELENIKAAGNILLQVEQTAQQTEVNLATEKGQPTKVEQSNDTSTVNIVSESGQKDKQAEIELATEKVHRAKAEKSNYKSHTQRLALWTSLTFGIAMSMVGVRSLEPLVAPEVLSSVSTFQRGAFHVIDVLLTGGLVAGGSEGVHKITQVFTEFFDKTRSNIKNSS